MPLAPEAQAMLDDFVAAGAWTRRAKQAEVFVGLPGTTQALPRPRRAVNDACAARRKARGA